MSTPSEDAPSAPKKSRWESIEPAVGAVIAPTVDQPKKSRWGTQTPMQPAGGSTPAVGGGTPAMGGGSTPSFHGGATPSAVGGQPGARWGTTPSTVGGGGLTLGSAGSGGTPFMVGQGTPSFAAQGWATPAGTQGSLGQTPMATVSGAGFAPTPSAVAGAQQTPTPLGSNFIPGGAVPEAPLMDPKTAEIQLKMKLRNRHLLDEEIEAMMPEGFEVLAPPEGYIPKRNSETNPNHPDYEDIDHESILEHAKTTTLQRRDIPDSLGAGMPKMFPDDAGAFELLLEYNGFEDDRIPKGDLPKVAVLRALLRIKNGDTNQRRVGTKFLVDRAKTLGSALLFRQIFGVWTANILDLQQRHHFAKLIERLLFVLREAVTPQVRDILQVISPMLANRDNFVRDEARDIIRNLAKAVGITPILKEVRPDIDDEDETVRTLTARILALTAQALGVDRLIKFLDAVCGAKNSWLARHTGVKTIYETAGLMHMGVIKSLPDLTRILGQCVHDPQPRVNCDCGFAVAALASGVAPYGIEHFNPLIPAIRDELWNGRGKTLSAYLRALGAIIPLMQPADAAKYARDMMGSISRHLATPDEELKRVLMRVLSQCVASDGISAQEIREQTLTPFFENFWNRRLAGERKSHKALYLATVAIAKKIGSADVLQMLIPDMKDTSMHYRRVVLTGVQRVVRECGIAELTKKAEEQLVDAILQAVEADETGHDAAASTCCSAVFVGLGSRMKDYAEQIIRPIVSRLNHSTDDIRGQAGVIIYHLIPVLKVNLPTEDLVGLGSSLFTLLGNERHGDALAKLLRCCRAILEVIPEGESKPPLDEIVVQMSIIFPSSL